MFIIFAETKQNIMEHYKVWKLKELEIRNYGGVTYNVYFDGEEVDCFTLYNKELEEVVINDYITETLAI